MPAALVWIHHWGNIGEKNKRIMEKKMETTIIGYIGIVGYILLGLGIMEKKMETTIVY